MKHPSLDMLEADLAEHVRKICEQLGALRYHTYDSRRSEPGFPDEVIAGACGVMFRELKTEKGRVTPPQRAWLDRLTEAGQDAGVWRPSDLLSGRIAREVLAVARAKPSSGGKVAG